MYVKYLKAMLFVGLLLNQLSTLSANPSLFSPILYPAEANERLGNKEVNELAEDEQGFIWLGTRRGLFRYDGYEYKRILFSSEHFDFAKIYVRALQTQGNNLWVGTMSSGMFHLDLKTYQVTQYIHDKENDQSIGSNQVNNFALDKNNVLWVANSSGLDKFDRQLQKFVHFQSSEKTDDYFYNYLLDIEFDSKNNLWLSTGKGLAILNKNTGAFKRAFQDLEPNDKNGASLNNVIIRKIYMAADQRIWLATQKQGSYIIDQNKSQELKNYKIIQLSGDATQEKKINTSIAQPSNNEIWISGVSGIEVRDAHTGELVRTIESNLQDKYSLNNKIVLSMLVSQSGLLWLSSKNFGLYYFNPHNHGFKRINKYLPQLKNIFGSYIAQTIKLSKHEVLVLSNQQAVRINLTTEDIKPLDTSRTSDLTGITQILKIDSHLILLGTTNGKLFSYDLSNNNVKNIPVSLNEKSGERISLLSKSKEGIWIAQENNLYHLNLKTLSVRSATNASGEPFVLFIKSLFVDSSKQLWIGTNKGFGLIKPNSFEVKMYSTTNNTQGTLSSNSVHQIIEDVSGNILINTRSGINKLNKTNNNELLFEPFAAKATAALLTDEVIFSDNDSSFWLGPQFHLDEKGNVLAEYGIADGLLKGQRGRSILSVDENRQLYASSELLIFEPEKIKDWTLDPKMVISDFSVNGNTLPSGSSMEGIHLKASDNSFTVRFSSLDYTNPMRNIYRYKLVGYDEKWVETPSDIRQAKYTFLPPGDYSLLLEGTNRNGVWTSSPLKIPVKIEAKYYQTFWFRILLFAVFSLLIYIVFKWRISVIKIRLQNTIDKENAIEKSEMMAELIEKKNQLLADVSHELRTPLTVLQLKVEALQHRLVENVDASYESLIEVINEINVLIQNIYQLAQSDIGALELNKTTNNCKALLSKWSNDLAETAKASGFDWHENINLSDSLQVEFDADKIKQVLGNLVDNSIAYTDSPGRIGMIVKASNEQLEIIIEDSSPSVSESDLTKIFERLYRIESSRSRATGGSGLGLAICKSIIEAHNGTLSSAKSEHGGLAISIKLPLNYH